MLECKYGQYDQTIVKIYGTGENRKVKVVNLAYLRTKGTENEKTPFEFGEAEVDTVSPEDATDEAKLRESICRAKQKIFELAFCNDWDFFFTGTLDQTKYDRSDLEKYHADLTKWFSNIARGKEKIEYLLVPELHANGGWHLHGFIKGIDQAQLTKYQRGMKMNASVFAKIEQGDTVYAWGPYEKKFGFCTVEVIKNPEAISKYIQKYMSKDLGVHVSRLGAHLYYRSRGLNEARFVISGSAIDASVPTTPSYSSEWCKVWWLDYSDELIEALRDEIIRTDYSDSKHNIALST